MRPARRVALPLLAITVLLTGCRSPDSECEHCSTASTASPEVTAEHTPGKQAPAIPANSYITDWISPANRRAFRDFSFTNQDGTKVQLSDLRGAPVAVSFIYTRCQNQRKCPLVAKSMAGLQTVLEEANVTPSPSLALITYDPEFDTPARLKSFGELYAMRNTKHAMLLQPEAQAKEDLFRNLNVSVNFNAQGVNLHGIQIILLDKLGRYVRTYHSLIWNNADVVGDLTRLASE